jgi:transcription-repair coupling factor (superfamily II helicase)
VQNHGLVARLGQGYPVAKLQSSLKNKRIEIVAPQSANSLVLSLMTGLRDKIPTLQLIIVATGREAEDLERDLRFLEPDSEVLLFPSWETLPHERLSPSPETVGQRLQTISRLAKIAKE